MIECNEKAWRDYDLHECPKEGRCVNASKSNLPGIGVLIGTCPWSLIRDPVWRASVMLAAFVDIGAVPNLLTHYSAQVGFGVLAYRNALSARRAQLQREASKSHAGEVAND